MGPLQTLVCLLGPVQLLAASFQPVDTGPDAVSMLQFGDQRGKISKGHQTSDAVGDDDDGVVQLHEQKPDAVLQDVALNEVNGTASRRRRKYRRTYRRTSRRRTTRSAQLAALAGYSTSALTAQTNLAVCKRAYGRRSRSKCRLAVAAYKRTTNQVYYVQRAVFRQRRLRNARLRRVRRYNSRRYRAYKKVCTRIFSKTKTRRYYNIRKCIRGKQQYYRDRKYCRTTRSVRRVSRRSKLYSTRLNTCVKRVRIKRKVAIARMRSRMRARSRYSKICARRNKKVKSYRLRRTRTRGCVNRAMVLRARRIRNRRALIRKYGAAKYKANWKICLAKYKAVKSRKWTKVRRCVSATLKKR